MIIANGYETNFSYYNISDYWEPILIDYVLVPPSYSYGVVFSLSYAHTILNLAFSERVLLVTELHDNLNFSAYRPPPPHPKIHIDGNMGRRGI